MHDLPNPGLTIGTDEGSNGESGNRKVQSMTPFSQAKQKGGIYHTCSSGVYSVNMSTQYYGLYFVDMFYNVLLRYI